MGLFNWIKENWVTVAATAVTAIATGGTSLIAVGIAAGAGYLLDADRKQRELEEKQLNIAGQAGQAIRGEINNIQDKRTQDVSQLNTLQQQVTQKQAKLNDPNTPEHEKVQIRSEIASAMSQASTIEQRIKGYDKQIEDLLKNVPGANNTKSQGIDTKQLLIIGGACLAIYLLVIKDKDK